MKKIIKNKIASKLLVLFTISSLISFIVFDISSMIAGGYIGSINPIRLFDIDPSIILIFSISIVIFVSIFLAGINGRMKYLKYISKSVTNIQSQQFLKPIDVKGSDEIAELASNINIMSNRLKENYEKEKRQEEAKNELIVAVSHDLKTPLTSIMGYLELLNKDKETFTKEQQEFLQIAYGKSENLKKLIDELFEYTKLSNNYIKLDKAPFNMAVLVNQIVGEHILFLSENNIKVEIQSTKEELMCSIDVKKIIRVIENLIRNVEKYSYGDSTFIVKMWEDEDNIRLTFTNEGDSLKNDDLEKIFEEMYRIDKSRNVEIEGSGLGLPISKKIIELHGGRIWAECNGNIIDFNIELPKA